MTDESPKIIGNIYEHYCRKCNGINPMKYGGPSVSESDIELIPELADKKNSKTYTCMTCGNTDLFDEPD